MTGEWDEENDIELPSVMSQTDIDIFGEPTYTIITPFEKFLGLIVDTNLTVFTAVNQTKWGRDRVEINATVYGYNEIDPVTFFVNIVIR